MEKSNLKNIVISILSAFVVGAATFFALIVFFFLIGLFGWTDGGEKHELERLEKSTNITFTISIIVSILITIYILVRMNKTKIIDKDSFPPDIP